MTYAKINRAHKVVYDGLDGLNWLDAGEEENFDFFHKSFSGTDFYFKRAYRKELENYAPDGCKVYPMGLNCNVSHNLRFGKGIIKQIAHILNGEAIRPKEFELEPVKDNNRKILFVTRLWDPEEVDTDERKADREWVNKQRVDMIQRCKKEYGDDFRGGMIDDPFTRKHCPELILPDPETNRKVYVKNIKEHAICVSTTGLHHSIPWKVGEYVSASRAIVTEPLYYEVPGEFASQTNYLEYTNTDELISGIDFLRENPDAMHDMMAANWKYYNTWLRPDRLVWNTILTILSAVVA